MTYDDLIKHYGTPTKAGEALGLKNPRQMLYSWRNRVPIDRQIEYEVATGGKLKADLPKIVRRSAA
jgi:hypothetical protein